MRQRARLYASIESGTRLACQGRGDGAEAGRRRRELTPSITWDGTPRRGPSTQFSPPERRWRSLPPPIVVALFYLWCALGCVLQLCCSRIARVVDSLPLDAVFTACRQSQRAKSLAGNSGRMRSSTSAVRSSNRYVRSRVRAPAELVHRGRGMTATPHAMPSNSTALVPKAATCRNPSLNKQSASVQHSR